MATVLILGFSGLTLSVVHAAFTSEAVSGGNKLRGGSIEITVTEAADYPSESRGLILGESATAGGEIKNTGKNRLRYALVLAAAETDNLCPNLFLLASRNGSLVYSGPLTTFSFPSSDVLNKGATDTWNFVFSLPDTAPKGSASCAITPTFSAWQEAFALPTSGWADTATLAELNFEQREVPAAKSAAREDGTPSQSPEAAALAFPPVTGAADVPQPIDTQPEIPAPSGVEAQDTAVPTETAPATPEPLVPQGEATANSSSNTEGNAGEGPALPPTDSTSSLPPE